MKKFFSFLMMTILILMSSIQCFAAEPPQYADGNVYAKYNYYSNNNVYTSVINNGTATVDIGNDIKITVSIDVPDGFVLVVHKITKEDNESYNWFKKMLPEEVETFTLYDIFLLDLEQKRVELPTATQIEITNQPSDTNVYSVITNEEKVLKIKSNIENETLTFKSGAGDYFILYANYSDAKSPQTGDNSNIILWYALLFAASGGIIITIIYNKERKNKLNKNKSEF